MDIPQRKGQAGGPAFFLILRLFSPLPGGAQNRIFPA
jgi:hypothetical protein